MEVEQVEYVNPGRLFVKRFAAPKHSLDLPEYLDQYGRFLREESGIGHDPPIDLNKICKHFGIRLSERLLSQGMDGVSSESEGLIFVNQEHSLTRKRFTIGHELAELLFAVLKESVTTDELWFRTSGHEKELYCNSGAAAILIPTAVLTPISELPELSFSAIESLAQRCRTSFLAAAISSVWVRRDATLIAWKVMLKPKEVRRDADGNQLSLGDDFAVESIPKLRIHWVIRSRATSIPFLPRFKSAPEDSIITRCLEERRNFLDERLVDDLTGSRHCFVDAIYQHPDSDFQVLTLLRWPQEAHKQASLPV